MGIFAAAALCVAALAGCSYSEDGYGYGPDPSGGTLYATGYYSDYDAGYYVRRHPYYRYPGGRGYYPYRRSYPYHHYRHDDDEHRKHRSSYSSGGTPIPGSSITTNHVGAGISPTVTIRRNGGRTAGTA